MAERDSVYHYEAEPYSQNSASPEPATPGKSKKPRKKPRIKVKASEQKASAEKNSSIFTIILLSVLAFTMLGYVIYCGSKSYTVYNDVASKTDELKLVQAENVRLQSELENRMSAKNVEEYAENVLGMKKIDSSQIKYIQIQTDDVVNIPQQDESLIAKIKEHFDNCVEYFRG